jgi:hypothetical protein
MEVQREEREKYGRREGEREAGNTENELRGRVRTKGDNGVRERDSGEEEWSEKLCVREGGGREGGMVR